LYKQLWKLEGKLLLPLPLLSLALLFMFIDNETLSLPLPPPRTKLARSRLVFFIQSTFSAAASNFLRCVLLLEKRMRQFS
jgi:hypothetical protein